MANDQFPTPRPTDPVPNAKSTVINDDALVLDYVVNSEGLVKTRTGKTLKTLSELAKSFGYLPINGGVWAPGIQFNYYNEFMIYNGVSYKPLKTTTLPYISTATPDVLSVTPFDNVPDYLERQKYTLQDGDTSTLLQSQVSLGQGANAGSEQGVTTVGSNSSAIAPGSVAIGQNAAGKYDPAQEPDINIAQTVTVGWNSKSVGSRGTAIGISCEAAQHSFASGRFSKALGYRGIAIGDSAEVPAVSPITGSNTQDSIAIGYNTLSDSNSCISIGTDGTNGKSTNASQPNCIAIGQGAHIKERAFGTSDDSIVIGNSASTSGSVSAPSTAAAVVMGFGATVESFNCVSIGREAKVLGGQSAFSVSIGNRAKVSGEAGVAIGSFCDTQQSNGVAIGDKCVTQDNAVAIGDTATANPSSVSIGHESAASNTNTVAVGRLAVSSHLSSVALGERSVTTANKQANLGDRHVEMKNVTTQSAPAAGAGRYYFRDNGGTQEFVVIFANGTEKVISNDS